MIEYILLAIPVAATVAGYIIAGDWDSLVQMIMDNKRTVLVAVQVAALFVCGVFKLWKVGAMLGITLIATFVWGE